MSLQIILKFSVRNQKGGRSEVKDELQYVMTISVVVSIKCWFYPETRKSSKGVTVNAKKICDKMSAGNAMTSDFRSKDETVSIKKVFVGNDQVYFRKLVSIFEVVYCYGQTCWEWLTWSTTLPISRVYQYHISF